MVNNNRKTSMIFIIYGLMQLGFFCLESLQSILIYNQFKLFNVYILITIELCCLLLFRWFYCGRKNSYHYTKMFQAWSTLLIIFPCMILFSKLSVSLFQSGHTIAIVNYISDFSDFFDALLLCMALLSVKEYINKQYLNLFLIFILGLTVCFKFIANYYSAFIVSDVFLTIAVNILGYLVLGIYLKKKKV